MDNAIIQSETINVKPEGMFRTAVMGFKRDDVLEYIENLCNENILQQSQLSQTVYALREQLNMQMAKNSETQQQLSARLAELTAQNEQITQQLSAALEEGNALKAKLYAKEQEYAALEEKNAVLIQQKKEIEQQIENVKQAMQERAKVQDERERSLNAQMQEIINKRSELESMAQAQLAQAKQQAESILAQANMQVNTIISEADMRAEGLLSNATQRAEAVMSEAEFKAKQVVLDAEQKAQEHKQLMAGGIKQLSDSLAELKSNLSIMENRITEANKSVQNAAVQMNTALGDVQENITVLGRQVDGYPEAVHIEPPLLKPEEMSLLQENEEAEQQSRPEQAAVAEEKPYVELDLPQMEAVPVYAGIQEQEEQLKYNNTDDSYTQYPSSEYKEENYINSEYANKEYSTAGENYEAITDSIPLYSEQHNEYDEPLKNEEDKHSATDYSAFDTFSLSDYNFEQPRDEKSDYSDYSYDNYEYKESTAQDIIDSLKKYDEQTDYSNFDINRDMQELSSIYSELDEQLASEHGKNESNEAVVPEDIEEFYGSLIKPPVLEEAEAVKVLSQQMPAQEAENTAFYAEEKAVHPSVADEPGAVFEEPEQACDDISADEEFVPDTEQAYTQQSEEDCVQTDTTAHTAYYGDSVNNLEASENTRGEVNGTQDISAEPAAEHRSQPFMNELDEYMRYTSQNTEVQNSETGTEAVKEYNRAPVFEAPEEKPEDRFYDFIRQPGGFVPQPELHANEYAKALDNNESQVQRNNLPADFGEIPQSPQLFGQERAARRNVLENVANMLGKNN